MVRSFSGVWSWGVTLAACFNLSALLSRQTELVPPPEAAVPPSSLTQQSPPSSYSSSFRYWRNDHNVVHVIQTRFMQFQPDQLHLGRARLALFEMFCLRTLTMQSSQQFLWIIRTDPDLIPELKDGLIDLVRGRSNILVVGTNRPIDTVPFRSKESIEDIRDESLWYGDMKVLHEYHGAAQTRVVLETGLDADDGVETDFVRNIQREGAAAVKADEWKIWCLGDHTEWHPFSPYKNFPREEWGYLRTVTADELKICVTPGLTRGMGANATSVPGYNKSEESYLIDGLGNQFFRKHDMVRRLKRCSSNQLAQRKQRRQTRATATTACWQFLAPSRPNQAQAIRARTPTSTGMKNLQGGASRGLSRRKARSPDQVRAATALWNETIGVFSLDDGTIRRHRQEMKDNLQLILEDAIRGRCKGGENFSCKDSALQTLQRLLRNLATARKRP